MSPTSQTQAWLEAASGARYAVPEGAPSPINVGRVAAPGAVQDGIGIPQSEQTRFISRKHATLWRLDDGTWQVSDAGSASGLWVNGVKATGDIRFPLTTGTKLKLGNYEVTFNVASAAPAAEAAAESGGEDGGTMVLRDFKPSASVSQSSPSVAASVAPEEKRYLDTFGGNEQISIEIPLKPGISQWTVGRALKAEGNDGSTDHVSVPNLPEFTSVSRRQVMLMRGADGRWSVKNLSSQGSRLNNDPLSSETTTPLKGGDKLVMGNRPFYFREGVVKPHYNEEDFTAGQVLTDMSAGDNPDMMDTREIPLGSRHGQSEDSGELEPWGQLVENKLMGARSFPLRQRKTKIGSHPINSDIKIEDPGIDDLHATIEWHGKDCKIHSRSHDSPVRVNHAAYRVSPPLTTGTIITIGNQEYHIDVTGLPPEATSTLVVQRVSRLVIFGVFSVIAICCGTLYAAKTITPKAQVATAPPVTETGAIINDVLQSRGLAGISLLAALNEQGKMTPEQENILKQLQQINQLESLIDKSPERDFRNAVETVDKQMTDAKGIFAAAGLSPAMADQGWFKQLQDAFHDRRGKAYTSEWSVLLTALRENNLTNAQRMLVQMSHTQQELLDQAKVAIDRWSKIAEAMRTRTQAQILDGYMDGVHNTRSSAFIAAQRAELSGLVLMLNEIEKDPSETSDALMSSSQWKDYKDTLTMFDNTLKAIEAYQKAATGDFMKAFNALPKDKQTTLLKQMASNLAMWDGVQSEISAAGGSASSKPELVTHIDQVRLQFQQTMDQSAPGLQEVNSRKNGLESSRGTQASSLRQNASQLPEGFSRINKLLDAYTFDPSSAAALEIDSMTAKMVGLSQTNKTQAKDAPELIAIKAKINEYIQKGSMDANLVNSPRQIDSLLNAAGIKQ